MDQATLIALAQRANQGDPTAAAQLASLANGAGQSTSMWNVYYSSVRFGWAVTGSGPYTYTLAAGTQLRAFGYAIGDDLTQSTVGYPSGYGSATECETNLQKRAETVGGETVMIRGISAYLTADSDPYLALKTLENTSVVIAMNGEQQVFRLGRLAFLPGGGGLSSAGQSQILTPPQMESYARGVGAMTNGIGSINNFYPLPQPLLWKPSGEADSTLILRMTVQRTLTESATARTATAGGASTPGTAAFSPPTATGNYGTYVGVVIRLHSQQVGPRSQNF